MLQSVWAVVHGGRIEVAEPIRLAEGTRVLVTVFDEDDTSFWTYASETGLNAIWDNAQDDTYAQLRKE